MGTNSACTCNECEDGSSHSLYLLLSGTIPTWMLSTINSVIVTAVVFSSFCELNYECYEYSYYQTMNAINILTNDRIFFFKLLSCYNYECYNNK